jgi:hypothetical protein
MIEYCRSCDHFGNDPAYLESAIKGLMTFSSGYASVMADDGICRRHDRYVSARSSCKQHALRQQDDRPAEAAALERTVGFGGVL